MGRAGSGWQADVVRFLGRAQDSFTVAHDMQSSISIQHRVRARGPSWFQRSWSIVSPPGGSRADPHPELWSAVTYEIPLPAGGRRRTVDVVEPNSTAVQRFLRRDGLSAYEPPTVATLITLFADAEPGFTFFDVGANMGLYHAACGSDVRTWGRRCVRAGAANCGSDAAGRRRQPSRHRRDRNSRRRHRWLGHAALLVAVGCVQLDGERIQGKPPERRRAHDHARRPHTSNRPPAAHHEDRRRDVRAGGTGRCRHP